MFDAKVEVLITPDEIEGKPNIRSHKYIKRDQYRDVPKQKLAISFAGD